MWIDDLEDHLGSATEIRLGIYVILTVACTVMLGVIPFIGIVFAITGCCIGVFLIMIMIRNFMRYTFNNNHRPRRY